MSDWKDFVIKLCELGSTNSSKEIADVINKYKEAGSAVSSGQVAAVKANWARGAYK